MSKYITELPVSVMQAHPDDYVHDGKGWLYSPPSGNKVYKESSAIKQAAKLAAIRGMDYEVLKVREVWKKRTSFIPIRSDKRSMWVEYMKDFCAYQIID